MSLLKRLTEQEVTFVPVPQGKRTASGNGPVVATRELPKEPDIKGRLHKYLVEELKKHPNLDDKALEQLIPKLAAPFFEGEGERLTFEAKNQILTTVINELIGYGPITPFLADPDVSEVMVNGPYQIYVEKKGHLIKTDAFFRDDEHVLQVIEKIVTPLGRRVDESMPMVDARLPDGSRVNAIIPPLALNGPTVTIRKFSKKPLQIDDLVRFGTLSEEMGKFLDGCVKARLNMFISGGTGSGKTTTLNVLSSFIPNDERIITIEDAAELQLSQEHVVSLETRPPNIEGKGAITIRDLVRNSLRMRPERIVIGEVRSAEALDMLQAMNTGHDGSLATGHANSPRDMLSRLETMVLMAGMDLPVRAIREQISSAIDLIIQQSRLKDGSRKITHITEVLGMEGDTIVLQDLFVFKQTGMTPDGKIQGQFVSTGIRPHCAEKLEIAGIALPSEWFREEW
ncbi:CpaF family protein [Effusibacillus lacus]|uniref:Type II secretion system protein E n=1 Tax=Effusibacillus lacus TaxID=1348429 RepID=A0A292YNL4_9BACL|nr:CpaF family protein [Effusibacillus lacus]TCS70376.1 pilus assembly protein CpaF [Effusibacillus lacus]GAX91528.1 type II secretion system protein E [Effusibacillus lacus]